MAALSSSPSMEDGDSASKTRQLFIKIKIPNATTGINSPGAGEGHIVCEYCGKRFTSGKAWGGHKRHHLQMKKKQKLQQAQSQAPLVRKTAKNKPCRTIYATIRDGKPICRVCYKGFSSLNSLFGHMMRFHRERDRRGIRPPATIDLMSDLVGWLKKDKRGRLCSADLVPQAAHNLMNLYTWSVENTFSCEICNKNFPTCQALEDHKRSHWKASATPPASASSSNGHRKTFDLNKVPYLIENGDEYRAF